MASIPKVPNKTTGTAIAGINVALKFCKKRYITAITKMIASTKVFITSSTDIFINSVLSFGYAISNPSGKFLLNSSILAFTNFEVSKAFAPGANITANPAAG